MEPASGGRGVLTVRWRGRFSAMAAAVLGSAAWTVVLYLVLRKYGEDGAAGFYVFLPAAVVCILGIAGGLFLAVCQIYGWRAVFDPAIRAVIVGGLTGKRAAMSFESVASVARVEEVTPLSTRTVFCLVPKLSPLFGVRAISGPLRPGSEKYADFERRVVPEITRMLGIDEGTRTGRGGVSALPTVRYRKEGSCYVKNFWGFANDFAGAAISLVLLSLLLFFAYAPDIHSAVFFTAVCASVVMAVGAARCLAFFFFLRIRSVCVDGNAEELRVKRGVFGWGRVRVHPFSSVKCFEVFWRVSPGANPSGRKISLVLDGARETVNIIPNARRGKETADEMRFLAGMFGLDPARDITYKRGVINIFAD